MEYIVGGLILFALVLALRAPIQDDPTEKLRMKHWDGQM